MVAHKIFSITTWLPDNAMRWTGQQIQNLGEGQDAKSAGTVIAGHVSGIGSTARMGGIGTGGGGGGMNKDGTPDTNGDKTDDNKVSGELKQRAKTESSK